MADENKGVELNEEAVAHLAEIMRRIGAPGGTYSMGFQIDKAGNVEGLQIIDTRSGKVVWKQD